MKKERAKLTFKRTIDHGDRKATLMCIQGVRTYDKLPAEYLRCNQYFYRGDTEGKSLGTICIVGYRDPTSSLTYCGFSEPHHHTISQGDTINGDVLHDLINYFRGCGKTLGEISRRQAKENVGWNAEMQEVEI